MKIGKILEAKIKHERIPSAEYRKRVGSGDIKAEEVGAVLLLSIAEAQMETLVTEVDYEFVKSQYPDHDTWKEVFNYLITQGKLQSFVLLEAAVEKDDLTRKMRVQFKR
jgi:hypothetical protein